MPELPEVETVRRGLERWCLNTKIVGIQTLHPRSTSDRSFAPLDVLLGSRIIKISRRGKFLWFVLDGPSTLVAHLGMSGQFRVQPIDLPDEKHLRARLTLKNLGNPTKITELRFVDQRTFGWLAVSEYQGDIPTLMVHISPDIFDPLFDRDSVISIIRSKKIAIKKVLLDQSVMSGVGNIYADESLWRAKIHPLNNPSSLSVRKISVLLKSVESVMSQALKEGGTSFDSLYTNVNGESGYFENSLNAYGRTDQPCTRCGNAISRIIVGGRSSHFCSRCQVLT
jgi:formamidopyrimidine-DNA glycosylase